MAAAADASLAGDAPVLTRRTLPPRLPPGSYATPGAPSSVTSGVYLSDRAKQLAEAQAEAAAAAAAAQEQYGFGGSHKPSGGGGSPNSSPFGRSGGGGRNSTKLQPIIDYSYPELGHSVVSQQQVR